MSASESTVASAHSAGSRVGSAPNSAATVATPRSATAAAPSQSPSSARGFGDASPSARDRSTVLPEVRNACALYRECASRCSSASGQAPSPHCISMKPICAIVDHASMPFTVVWVVMTSAASTAVVVPMATSMVCAGTASDISGASRMSTKPPMFTTPAWSSADTGVGASITCASQPWNGSCALWRATQPTTSTEAPCRAGDSPGEVASASARPAMERVPRSTYTRASAPRSATSATRLTKNFLCAARSAAGRSKCVSSWCRHRLASVHDAATTSRWSAPTSVVTAASVAASQRA